MMNMWKLKVFKKLSMWFSIDRNLDSIDRKCLLLIQQQLSTDRNRQNQTKFLIAISIGRETGLIDWNSGKINFLKNKAILCKNSSKHSILWKNAWVWDEILFKNTCFEPSFPKNKIFNQFSLNSQTSNTFCINIKEFRNSSTLVVQTKITYNNMYKV